MPSTQTSEDRLFSNGKPSKRSVPLAEHLYRSEEYFCTFSPRIHSDAHLADEGSWQCQVDFLNASGPDDSERNKAHKSYAVGCINPVVGNFTALCACEALPERLALVTYMVEYAYIHDDVIEYAKDKDEARLRETNRELVEGLDMEETSTTGTKQDIKRRQLQSKMAVELIDIDREKGFECLRLWKEMSDVFVQIRDLNFKNLDEYLPFRVVDAGCPWTMSLLCFSMDFSLTKDEEQRLSTVTSAAYNAWVLVNDYFSWEKEFLNYESNGSTGEIVSAVHLFMKWYNVDAKAAKLMLRNEILARERIYCEIKTDFASGGKSTEKTDRWFELLDLVTAGNFAWSMTTARYDLQGLDAYPALRAKQHEHQGKMGNGSLDNPISSIVTNGASALTSKGVQGHNGFTELPRRDSHYTDVTPSKTTTLDGSTNGKSSGVAEASLTLSDVPLSSFEPMVLEPWDYVQSMPSKGVRNSAIDALDLWYETRPQSLATIRDIVNTLHNASLMLDDIQDGSPLRRGFPATHVVYGLPQTINTANLMITKAIKMAENLSPAAMSTLLDRLVEAHIGQGMDLQWKHLTTIPTEGEYFAMVDGKTGGLFRLIADLMRAEATINQELDLRTLMLLLGRFFQTRDDCQNLDAPEYAGQKGFAEDIGEGKLSLPLICALRSPAHRGRLLSILEQRKSMPDPSFHVRKLAVDQITAAGGLQYARRVAQTLETAVQDQLTAVEDQTGKKNWILRLMQRRLHME